MRASLRASVERLGQDLVELLQRAVQDCLIGCVEWSGPAACHYVYFRDVIAQQNNGSPVSESYAFVPRYSIQGLPLSQGAPLTLGEWQRTSSMHSQVEHRSLALAVDHHAMHARQTSIRDSRVLRPPAVERLVAAVPDWLYDFVRVVEAQLIREQVEVADLSAGTVHATRPAPQPTFRSEPALVLGPFVLTGWTQSDIDAEQQLLDEQAAAATRLAREQTARWELRLWSPLARALIFISVVLFGCMLWITPGTRIWFAVAAGLGVLAATQVARARCALVGVAPRWYHLASAGAVVSALCCSACLFLLSVNRGRVLDSLLAALLVCAAFWLSQANAKSPVAGSNE